jgi:hypothetical protein
VAAVYSAEHLNALGNANWRAFAHQVPATSLPPAAFIFALFFSFCPLISCSMLYQNYFDRSGVFVSLMWSAPLILISMFVLVCHTHVPTSPLPF